MTKLSEAFEARKSSGRTQDSSLDEHVEMLAGLAAECESIVEFGSLEGNSATAFLWGLNQGASELYPKMNLDGVFSVDNAPRHLHLVEIKPEHLKSTMEYLEALSNGRVTITSELTNSVNCAFPDNVDLLFIDDDHNYPQLTREFALFADKVRKYIAIHDTVLFPKLVQAIDEFLEANKHWKLHAKYEHQFGMYVLVRDPASVPQSPKVNKVLLEDHKEWVDKLEAAAKSPELPHTSTVLEKPKKTRKRPVGKKGK